MQVFETIFPIVVLAALGYLLRKRSILNQAEAAALERFTFNFLIPCLLFLGTATAELPEQMDWYFLFGFYLAVVLVYLLGLLIGRLMFGYSLLQQSVFGMGGAYSNVTVVGIPVCLELLGEQAFLPMFILISIHNLFLFAFGTVVAECRVQSGRNLLSHVLGVMKNMVLNPITGSLIAGGLVNLLGVPIYQPVLETVSLLSRAAVPMALFALGAALTRYEVRGEINAALVMVGLKLLVLPTLVWLLMFHVFTVNALWGATAVLLSAMPCGISTYVFSRRYQCCETQAGAAIILSSVLSVFSISLFALLLKSP